MMPIGLVFVNCALKHSFENFVDGPRLSHWIVGNRVR
jgi:hypothetical protein